MIKEHHFAQLGASSVIARSTMRWVERGYGWRAVWSTSHALVVDGRELTINGEPFSIGDVSGADPTGELLGGARYRVRVVTARGPGVLVFDLDAMTVELGRLWPTGAS